MGILWIFVHILAVQAYRWQISKRKNKSKQWIIPSLFNFDSCQGICAYSENEMAWIKSCLRFTQFLNTYFEKRSESINSWSGNCRHCMQIQLIYKPAGGCGWLSYTQQKAAAVSSSIRKLLSISEMDLDWEKVVIVLCSSKSTIFLLYARSSRRGNLRL